MALSPSGEGRITLRKDVKLSKQHLVAVMSDFRNCPSPDEDTVGCFSDGEHLVTMSLPDIRKNLCDIGCDPEEICEIMGLDPTREILVGMAHAAIGVANNIDQGASGTVPEKPTEKADGGPSPAKKRTVGGKPGDVSYLSLW